METVTLQWSDLKGDSFFLHCFFSPIQTVSYCTALKQLLLNINTFDILKAQLVAS